MQERTTHNYLIDTLLSQVLESPHEIELNEVLFQCGRIDCS